MANGGILRALRHEMGYPLYYSPDDRDYQLLSRHEMKWVGRIGVVMMLLAQGAYMGFYGMTGMRGKK